MRVITGIAKGKRLVTCEGDELVRPTPERVKEGIFSALQFDLEGRTFLDLFAGSGQMGIEALSRGAEYCLFCDGSREAVQNITRNLENTGLSQKAKVIRADYSALLNGVAQKFDIVFLDPPYSAGILNKAANMATSVIKPYGMLICEHPKEQSLPESFNDFVLIKTYKYGRICISVYKKRNDDIE